MKKIRVNNEINHFQGIERNNEMDILKGLGIIAVVTGHCGIPIAQYLYMYHLAIFFFISGFLYKDKHSSDPFSYFTSRLRSLWLPFVKYGLCFVLLHNIFSAINIYNQSVSTPINPLGKADFIIAIQNIILMKSTEPVGMAMWFVMPLFVAMNVFCIIGYLTKNISSDYKKTLIIIIISLACYNIGAILIDKKAPIEYYADVALLIIPIISGGYIYNKIHDKINIGWIGRILIGALSIYLLVKCKREVGFVSLNIKYYISREWFLVVSFAGIYLNIVIAKCIIKIKFLNKLIVYLGQKSFHIMALHLLMFKIAGLIICVFTHQPISLIGNIAIVPGTEKYWILYTVVGIGTSILCINIISKFVNWVCNLSFIKRNFISTLSI